MGWAITAGCPLFLTTTNVGKVNADVSAQDFGRYLPRLVPSVLWCLISHSAKECIVNATEPLH